MMQVIQGGHRRLTNQRYAAWCAVAIGALALSFPATAVAARGGAKPATTADRGRGGDRGSAGNVRLGHAVLTLGSGYRTPGGTPAVRAVQRHLALAGYPSGPIDGLYGPRTRRAVIAFQATHGLAVDGVVGPRTWAALNVPGLALVPGAGDLPGGSDVVRLLQRRLASAGDSPGPIDGRYGVLTERAVRRFQLTHGLQINGVAGPDTLAALARPTRLVQHSKPPRPRPRQPVPRSSVPRPSSHRPGSGAVPWMVIFGGLALALALVLAAPLLVAGVRLLSSRRRNQTSVATMGGGAKLAALEPRGLTKGSGHENGSARVDAGRLRVNGHRAPEATRNSSGLDRTDDIANGANGPPAGSEPEAPPESADPAAAFYLGLLLEAEGSVLEAQAAYRRADHGGHGKAASNLGRLLEELGALAEAEAAYRRADERGDAVGAFNLGVLLEERNALDEAAAAYRRAAARGHHAAAANLGVLLEEQGALDEAEAEYRRADEGGDATAAFNLGVLLEERGALIDAEAAYGRAEQRGGSDVANMARAALLDLRGALQEAGSGRGTRGDDA